MLKIKKLQENAVYDSCVLCGKKTEYRKSIPIDKRIGYIEGAGQLCRVCHKDTYAKGGAHHG